MCPKLVYRGQKQPALALADLELEFEFEFNSKNDRSVEKFLQVKILDFSTNVHFVSWVDINSVCAGFFPYKLPLQNFRQGMIVHNIFTKTNIFTPPNTHTYMLARGIKNNFGKVCTYQMNDP